MPRRKFTARDLAPLRKITEKVLKKEPDAALVASAAVPFKRRMPRGEKVELGMARLPVEIQSRDHPEGVPMHKVAKMLKEEVPGVTGISAAKGGVSLKFDRKPSPETLQAVEALLTDAPNLEMLRAEAVAEARTGGIRQPSVQPDPAQPDVAAPSIAHAPVAQPIAARRPIPTEVREVLHDRNAPDEEWFDAFRKFAMANLVPPEDG